MLKRKSAYKQRSSRETHRSQNAALMFYHRLDDGRMVPIESGGLVELALSELGARLVDAREEIAPNKVFGLN